MTQNIYCNTPDADAPCSLKPVQEWFSSVITSRLDEDDHIHPVAPSGMLIAEEAAKYIVPSPTLQPHLRMQIYNQQYWWRLLKTLHENFPLLTRLFGYHAFNETIGIPYLLKYPPHHWSLSLLGERLTKWIAEEYHEADKPLIHNATQLDWAFMASFISSQVPSLDLTHLHQGDFEQLLSHTFYLQPFIHLFKWDYDLLAFREAFLKHDVDYWTDNNFPPLAKGRGYHFVLFRTEKNNIFWKEISSAEYILLQSLKQGSTIEVACEQLENREASVYELAEQHLQNWIVEWVQRGWLTLHKPA